MFNSQRGVSFIPASAAKARTERRQRVEEQIREVAPRKVTNPHGRMLDEIEHAYRERARDRGRPSR